MPENVVAVQTIYKESSPNFAVNFEQVNAGCAEIILAF